MNDLVSRRIDELLTPVDVQIYQCDKESALLLACGMIQRAIAILDAQLGESGRKDILGDYI